jgi:hypothetical protein
MKTHQLRTLFQKLFRWEFWSLKVICLPLMPWWLYYSAKLKSFFFFSAANPAMPLGGLFSNSRIEILEMLPPNLVPTTILIDITSGFEHALVAIENSIIRYPFIVKPDSGMNALGVAVIETQTGLKKYFDRIDQNFLVQELILYPKEIGIFYCRKPGQERGTITGIVEKEFLHVVGNGVNTFEQLVRKNPRAQAHIDEISKRFGTRIKEVLEDDEYLLLNPIASRNQGTKFTDRTFKKNNHLIKAINQICRKIPGFYYGRLDIRYQSFDDLCRGEHFTIIDLNGANSIPLHIYDHKHSLFFAWREIIKHWKWLFEISKINVQRGHELTTNREGISILKKMSKLKTKLTNIEN